MRALRLQLSAGDVTQVLTLLYRAAQETPPDQMEFLTVDAPQDCIHLIHSMERDNSPDLAEARDLLTSLNGGCSAGDRVANVDAKGNVYPCQFARAPEFLVGNIRDRPFSLLWNDADNPVLSRFRTKLIVVGRKCGSWYLSFPLRRRVPGAGLGSGRRRYRGGSILLRDRI